jgi:hypothetical protein
MREILLSRGLTALVDDEDYEELVRYRWYAHNPDNGRIFYAKTNLPRIINKPRTQLWMHKILLNPPKGMEVDHIDGNGLNNQKSNLRVVTHRENQQNFHIIKTSRFPGVALRPSGKWISYITLKGKWRYLGTFVNEIDAATTYQVACATLCGDTS